MFANFTELIQITAGITTILQFLSGAVICRDYVKKKSTGDTSGFPFICGFLSCSFWLHYGNLIFEWSLIWVNAVGAGLFLIYIFLFYSFTVKKRFYVTQFGVTLCLLFGVIYMTEIIIDQPYGDYEEAVKLMGWICCITGICLFAAPLTQLLHVIRTKNPNCLPFPLILMSFLVSLQWLIYGSMISNAVIQIPNFLGCVLSLIQLCLFVCYPPTGVRVMAINYWTRLWCYRH